MIEEIKIAEDRKVSSLLLTRDELSLINAVNQKDMLEGKHIGSKDLLKLIENFEDEYKKGHELRNSLEFNFIIEEEHNVVFRAWKDEMGEIKLRISFKSPDTGDYEINKQNFIMKEIKQSLLLLFPSYFD